MKLDVICLCAQWCGTCRDYMPAFEALAKSKLDWRTHWVDIENHEASMSEVDITTFPMVLIVNAAGSLCFAGPLAPQLSILERMCQAAQRGSIKVPDEEALVWEPLLKALNLRSE